MNDTLTGRSGAIVGVFTSLLGTLIATMLLPLDPLAQGALTVPALVLAAGIVFVPVVRTLSGSAALLNAENFVSLGFMYWILLDPIRGAYDLYDATDVAARYALIAIGLSAACMWAGTFGQPWKIPSLIRRISEYRLDSTTLLKMTLVCFVLGMSNFVYSVDFDLVEMFSYLGQDRWSAPWGRGELGGWDAFGDHLQYFGYPLPSLAALIVARRGLLKPGSLLALGAAVIMVLFLSQGGGRRIIGVTVGAAILVWILARPDLKLRYLLGAGVGVLGLLYGMQFMLEIRTGGYQEYAAQGSRFELLHVDDNFLRLAQILELVPSTHPFVYFQQIFYILVRPIPRIFWEGKPIDPGFNLSSAIGAEGVSLSTSIIGEWYLSFSWFGVMFGGWLHGRLASAANTFRNSSVVLNNPILYALAIMVLVSGVRSMADLVIMSYAILALSGVTWLVTYRQRQRDRFQPRQMFD